MPSPAAAFCVPLLLQAHPEDCLAQLRAQPPVPCRFYPACPSTERARKTHLPSVNICVIILVPITKLSVMSRDDDYNDDLCAQRKIAGCQEMEEEGIVNRLQRQIETLLAKYKARHTIHGTLPCLPGCSRGSRRATLAACVVAKAPPHWMLGSSTQALSDRTSRNNE